MNGHYSYSYSLTHSTASDFFCIDCKIGSRQTPNTHQEADSEAHAKLDKRVLASRLVPNALYITYRLTVIGPAKIITTQAGTRRRGFDENRVSIIHRAMYRASRPAEEERNLESERRTTKRIF